MERFYHILLLFLTPLFVIGVDTFVKFLSKRKQEVYVSLLVLSVIVPYFLFQTSFVYEVVGIHNYSVPLSRFQMAPLHLYSTFGYVDAYTASGALWLSSYTNITGPEIYSDVVSREVTLSSYGMIYKGYINLISNTTNMEANGVLFMNTLNTVGGIVVHGTLSWNTTDLTFLFDDTNQVYCNGGSELYKNLP
jgi:uncharacterized membrane protein